MNRWQYVPTIVLILAIAMVGGCGPKAPAPTAMPIAVPTEKPAAPPAAEPTAVPTEVTPQVPDPIAARDAALAYVVQNYDQQVPGTSASWMEDDLTEEGLVGASTFQYTAEGWTVTVSFPIVAPSATIYKIMASDEATGFQWEGEIDVTGAVTEIAMVEGPDVLFEGIGFFYDDTIAAGVLAEVVPTSGEDEPDWAASPEHLQFSFESYALSDTFHRPRIYAYRAAELEAASDMGAAIIGAVRYALSERPAFAPPNSILPGFNAGQLTSTPAKYIDFANGGGVRFLTQMAQAYFPINNRDLFYAFQGLTDDGEWYVAAVLPVSHPSLAADGSEIPGDDFDAFAENFETYAAEISAQLDVEAPSSFTPDLSLLDAMMASLRMDTTEQTAMPVVAWGGFVKGQPEGAQFDDCLTLEPEGAGEVGLVGIDSAVDAQIQALRDSGAYAHFWGTMHCPAIDCGGCQLVVERLREDRPGPFSDPDPVEGWEGTIVSLPEGAEFDDYLLLAGDHPVGFGIEGADAGIAAELESLRDTGTEVRIWGQVEAGVPDAFGAHILVTRLEGGEGE